MVADAGMTRYVLRRSIVSMTALAVVLTGIGTVLVAVGLPVWIPVSAAILFTAGGWVVSPYLVAWLVPATEITRTQRGYDTDHVVGRLVALRCHEVGVPLVRLGIVDDGTPNAFTFGHTRADARIYLTRGLIERLDDDELDAVISHEVAHVRNNDIVVMAIASVVPMVMYYAFLLLRSQRNHNTVLVWIAAYAAYVVSQLTLLALARARELGADHFSCALTGDGDALCRALVKIGYGMGQVDAQRAARLGQLRKDKDKEGLKALRRETARHQRVHAAGVMGIADPAQSATVLAAVEEGLSPREVIGAMRWDAGNPWARFSQLFSTHPLVVTRIAALEDSHLPGAPTHWSAREVAASCRGPQLSLARRRFAGELLVRYAPTAVLVWGLVSWGLGDTDRLAPAATLLGLALLVRVFFAHRPGPAEPVDRVASLLTRLDASPVTGLPVSIRGQVIGRGLPGYVLSPDLVIQDESGFVTVRYVQPWPFARPAFGVLHVPELLGQKVELRGWYRRSPSPVVELRDLVPAHGRRVRGFGWAAAYLCTAAVAVIGALVWLVMSVS